MAKLTRFLSFLILPFIISPQAVSAIYFKASDSIDLKSDQTIDESVFISGKKLTVDSDINGDLYCAGEQVIVNGAISGDIFCAGQSVTINGLVAGTLRLAGQNIEVNSTINQNLSLVGQNINLSQTAVVKKDAFLFGQNVTISSPVSRDLGVASQTLTLNSIISRNATIALKNLNLASEAKINGNLDYYYESNQPSPQINNALVLGLITPHPINTPSTPADPRQSFRQLVELKLAASLYSSLLIGIFLIFAAREFLINGAKQIINSPLPVFLVGFAALILMPLLIIILAFSLLGLPLSILFLLLHLISLMLAFSFSAQAAGRYLLILFTKQKNPSLILSLILGIFFLGLLVYLPFVGFIFGLIILCLGLGAVYSPFFPFRKLP